MKLFETHRENSDLSTRDVARGRLNLTLFNDRLSLMNIPPETLEALKTDIMDVIDRYFVVDRETSICQIAQDQHELTTSLDIQIVAPRASATVQTVAFDGTVV